METEVETNPVEDEQVSCPAGSMGCSPPKTAARHLGAKTGMFLTEIANRGAVSLRK